jgi:hyperosmotically inducible periplasmic protein
LYIAQIYQFPMKTPTSLLLGSLLALSVVACDNAAKTSSSAPNSSASPTTTQEQPTTQTNQNDATSELRRKQLNSDMRAVEQRNDAAGDPNVKQDNDLKSQVRNKLEANLPASALAVESKDGAVTVSGSVVNQEQLQKIEPLAKQIGGVKTVAVKATVSAVTPEPPKPGSEVPIKDKSGAK